MMQLLSHWLQAVCSRDPVRVVGLYTSDAVLLGTFAKTVKQGREALYIYFNEFMSRPGLCGQVDTCIPQETEGSIILSGTYTFWWDGVDGKEEQRARFSFVFVPIGQSWLIVNHHSSVIP